MPLSFMLLHIFHRSFFNWFIAPSHILPSLRLRSLLTQLMGSLTCGPGNKLWLSAQPIMTVLSTSIHIVGRQSFGDCCHSLPFTLNRNSASCLFEFDFWHFIFNWASSGWLDVHWPSYSGANWQSGIKVTRWPPSLNWKAGIQPFVSHNLKWN